MTFEPIAIIGQSCLLPGALSPQQLWAAVRRGDNLLSHCVEGYWQLSKNKVWQPGSLYVTDQTYSDVGGYVHGFDPVFDARGFGLPPEQILALDPLFKWTLHGVREALNSSQPAPHPDHSRTGLVLGNLNYPSSGMTRFAQSIWLEAQGQAVLDGRAAELAGLPGSDARNRFCSGLPAQLTAQALGLGGCAFTLDAACASSLYAIKLACDQLHDRRADLMVAGAVNRADDLFIHVGFCALNAMSRRGRSTPFDAAADGLIPAEGAAFVTLKRLDDAVAGGHEILAVIRGVGLSNDGRSGGFLAPSSEGQKRAMQNAYQTADLSPHQISLLECHATGTPVGDATELNSSAHIFADHPGLPLGSLKSNMGHLITVAGTAGLLKVIAAMKAQERPPSINVDQATEALQDTPFRLLTELEAWPCEAPRRAAISAFGFGGNNAHLIVEQWSDCEDSHNLLTLCNPCPKAQSESVVVVGMEIATAEDFATSLLTTPPHSPLTSIKEIEIDLNQLRFPPNDLAQTLPQQLIIMETARKAAASIGNLPLESTSVLIGMGADPEIARYAARWRLNDWVELFAQAGYATDPAWLALAQQACVGGLQAAGVVGTMPNIPANRINAQLDLKGPSFTLSGEELSGSYALGLAIRALQHGEIDAALVGAVDLSSEPVHGAALSQLLGKEKLTGDAAVVLVLKRLEDAERHGDPLLAVLREGSVSPAEHMPELDHVFGNAHAAAGLLRVAGAVLSLRHRLIPGAGPAVPALKASRSLEVSSRSMADQVHTIQVHQAEIRSLNRSLNHRFHCFRGADANQVLAALQAGHTDREGPACLVILADTQKQFETRSARAQTYLKGNASQGFHQVAEDIFWCTEPLTGKTAFVFPGAAAAYPGMGRELLLAAPSLSERLLARYPSLVQAQNWLDPNHYAQAQAPPFEVLQGCSFMIQLHGLFSRDVLGLKPDAVLGVSSGETNAMFVSGAWSDLDGLFRDIVDSDMYSHEIAGEYNAARRAWSDQGVTEINWESYRVLAPIAEIEAAVAKEPFVHLTMINAPKDAVISGQAEGCARVSQALNAYHSIAMGHDIIAHAPEMLSWREPWYQIHFRETHVVDGIRFYANARGGPYQPSAENIADVLTQQAMGCVDFRKVVEAAWSDGVRLFVEHGPRATCSGWIRDILGERPHQTVAFDRAGNGLQSTLRAVAQMLAMGVTLDMEALTALLDNPKPQEPPKSGKTLKFAAHPQPLQFPPVSQEKTQPTTRKRTMPQNHHLHYQTMEPAPARPHPLPEGQLRYKNQPEPQACPPSVANPSAPLVGLEGLRDFHTQLSQAHQAFLRHQERGSQSLLKLHALMTAAPQAVISHPLPRHTPAQPEPKPPVLRRTAADTPPATAPVPPLAATPKEASPTTLPGPKYSRKDLEVLAGGKISDILGPLFKCQDHFPRQVRMPEPPLLLADRVTGIDAEAGAMGRKATIWTETDVTADAWYLNRGHMPVGVMIEAGQADLLLISYLGADFQNKGERVYRLLGCQLTFKGGLPKIGDTLAYDIHIDGYAEQGPVRLFFFHYDCHINHELRLSVRNGQAGFFTDGELANSGGILWDPSTDLPESEGRVDAPAINVGTSSFDVEQVRAFTEGRISACFGAAYALTNTHTATPHITGGRMRFFDEVTHYEPSGGPWGRGYLRAETRLAQDEWFFDGHFKNDPCMPGTLMFEGCFQTMAFYLAALGYSIDRDGWRFEPKPDLEFTLSCRGQVIPGAELLIYEVFVREVHQGPIPTLFADVLCTVDGLKAFHGSQIALQLVPGYPLESGWTLPQATTPAQIAQAPGIVFDQQALTASAWGRPSRAFGPEYRIFDGPRRNPRLPGPPYHFMSHISRLEAEMGKMVAGGTIEAAYQIPADAWYFSENGNRCMPFAVLLEAALQPCGWFASYMGCPLSEDEDLFFRNLDGTATQHADIYPDAGTLITRVKSTSVAKAGSIIITGFDVSSYLGETLVYEMKTVFGFFTSAALASQAGMPVSEEQRVAIEAPPNTTLNLTTRPAKYFDRALRLPGPMLSLLDTITEISPQGGSSGLGRIRATTRVDSEQWYFKAHFFGDSVQPGSLGLEPMLQMLQFYMIHRGMGAGITAPRFEAIQLGTAMTWKYRGQVAPNRKQVSLQLDITEISQGDGFAQLTGQSSLWVDGLRIYEATSVGMRIVSGQTEANAFNETLDPSKDSWLADYTPSFSVPTLPMMCMLDRMIQAAQSRSPGRKVIGVENLKLHRWVSFQHGPRRLDVIGSPKGKSRVACQLRVWDEDSACFLDAASGIIVLCETWPLARHPLDPPADAVPVANPYESSQLIHGTAFQALRQWSIGSSASSSLLEARSEVPLGVINPMLLNAATHGIPHRDLQQWSSRIPEHSVAYASGIRRAIFHGSAPVEGVLRCETRFAQFEGDSNRFPLFEIQLIHQNHVWAEITLVTALFPKLGELAGRFEHGLALSELTGENSRLSNADVAEADWLPGALPALYNSTARNRSELTKDIVMKEHIARLSKSHPAWIQLREDGCVVNSAEPLQHFKLEVRQQDQSWEASAQPMPSLMFQDIRHFWRKQFATKTWLGEDLFEGLLNNFLKGIVIEDPASFESLKGRGALFLGNHQTGVESLMFCVAVSAYFGKQISILAKDSHRDSWLGRMVDKIFEGPGLADPKLLIMVDRGNPAQVFEAMAENFKGVAANQHGLMVHAEGTRSRQCRLPMTTISSSLLDLAVTQSVPIVPVRFRGGLPQEATSEKLEFPYNYGKQEIILGKSLMPELMRKLTSPQRKQRVLDSLHGLGEPWSFEEPLVGEAGLAERIKTRMEGENRTETQAVLHESLIAASQPGEESRALLQILASGTLLDASEKNAAWLNSCAQALFGLEAKENP